MAGAMRLQWLPPSGSHGDRRLSGEKDGAGRRTPTLKRNVDTVTYCIDSTGKRASQSQPSLPRQPPLH